VLGKSHLTRNETFITHLAGFACFNVVHLDDAITLEDVIASSWCTHIKTLKVSYM